MNHELYHDPYREMTRLVLGKPAVDENGHSEGIIEVVEVKYDALVGNMTVTVAPRSLERLTVRDYTGQILFRMERGRVREAV